VIHGALLGGMAAAWWLARGAGRGALGLALGAALVFRIVMALGPPALSDDVYRYVWDGRVQLHGIHPYLHPPLDPALESLRDSDWEHINHRELETIYPPLSEAVFAGLAAMGAGVRGFKMAAGLADFAVVLALAYLLRCVSLPPERVLLYAWNPLAIVETAGSGHHEAFGIALVVLAAAWTHVGRPRLAALGLAGGIQIKLLPAAMIPSYVRRWPVSAVVVLTVATIAIALPYALTGPAFGGGMLHYAGRWERNGFLFEGILGIYEALDLAPWLKTGLSALQQRLAWDALPWDWLYRHVWPPHLARATAAALAVAWLARVSLRNDLDAARQTFAAFGGVLLLAPTMHPWYVLWILPFAAAFLSRGGLWLAALVPLAYLGGVGDVPWWARAIEFVPAFALLLWGRGHAPTPRRDSMGT
jgi:hypothetical protein